MANKTRKRMIREVIVSTVRRPNATSATQHVQVPFWAYSLHNTMKPRKTRVSKNKHRKFR
jgi:hypothetical protein